MLNLLSMIKWGAFVVGILCAIGFVFAAIPPFDVASGILSAIFSTLFLGLAYVGHRVERKIEDTAQLAIDTVGEHAGKISDALVERIKTHK